MKAIANNEEKLPKLNDALTPFLILILNIFTKHYGLPGFLRPVRMEPDLSGHMNGLF